MKHFINLRDHSPEELESILNTARRLKQRRRQGIHDNIMSGRILGMYFEKPSLRTRVSLEAAMITMGGGAICLDTGGNPLGTRESIADQARVMSRYVDAISIRTFAHTVVEEFARYSSVPVINALSDFNHPTQAMADIMTLREHLGDTRDKTLAFIGDGNNVARSLAMACAKLGMIFAIASPGGYTLDDAFLAAIRKEIPQARIETFSDPTRAVQNAAAVYTDVWASMGQEDEARERAEHFAPFQVNTELMRKAPEKTLVLHCLPAHRGHEITDEVIDSPASVVFDQAENRMHINRALISMLVTG